MCLLTLRVSIALTNKIIISLTNALYYATNCATTHLRKDNVFLEYTTESVMQRLCIASNYDNLVGDLIYCGGVTMGNFALRAGDIAKLMNS